MTIAAALTSCAEDDILLQASLQVAVETPTTGTAMCQKTAALCQETFSGASDAGHRQNCGVSKGHASTATLAMTDSEKEREKEAAGPADVQANAATSRSHQISILEDSPSAFTIRGYVAAVREKDIARCWPFSPWLLQQRLREGKNPLLPPLVDDVTCTDGNPTSALADDDVHVLNIVAAAADDDENTGKRYNHEEAADLQVQLSLDLSKSEAQLLDSAVEDDTNPGPATTAEPAQKIIKVAREAPYEKASSEDRAREIKVSPPVPSHAPPAKITRQAHRSIRDIRKSVMEGPCHCHQYCRHQSINIPRPQHLHVLPSLSSYSYDNNAEERPSLDDGPCSGCLLDDATLASETNKVRTGACTSHDMQTFAGRVNSAHETNLHDIADTSYDLTGLQQSHNVTNPNTNIPMQLEQESYNLLQVKAKRLDPGRDNNDDSNGASSVLSKYAAPQCVAGGRSLITIYSDDRNSEISCHDDNQHDPDDADHASIIVPQQKCPVCLVFQCSSNTALNAHIDHCLANFSHDDIQISKPRCPKTKARKKRSIAELYCIAAPPSCSEPEKDVDDDADDNGDEDEDEGMNDDDRDDNGDEDEDEDEGVNDDDRDDDHDRHPVITLSPTAYSADEKTQKHNPVTSLMSSRSSAQDFIVPTMKRNCNNNAITYDAASKEGKSSAEKSQLISQKTKSGHVKKSRLSGSATKWSTIKLPKTLKAPSLMKSAYNLAGTTYQVSDTRNELPATNIHDPSADHSANSNVQELQSYFEKRKDNLEPDENPDQGMLGSSIVTCPKVKTTLQKPINVVYIKGRQSNGSSKSSVNPAQRSHVPNLDQSTFKMIPGIEQTNSITNADADLQVDKTGNLLCAITATNSVDKSYDERERTSELISSVHLPTTELRTASQKVALFADCMEGKLNTINHDLDHQVQHHDSILEGCNEHVENSLGRLDERTAIRKVHNELQSQDKGFLVNRKAFPFQTGNRPFQENVPESCSGSLHQAPPFSESRIEPKFLPFSSSPLTPCELTPGFQSNNQTSLSANYELNQRPAFPLHEVDGPILTHAVINYNGLVSCQRQSWMPNRNYLQEQSQETSLPRECPERYIPRPMLPPVQVLELSTSLHTCRKEESVPAERHCKVQNSATHHIATQPERYSTPKLPPWMQAALNDHKSASFSSLDVTASDQSSLTEIPSLSRDAPTGPAILDATGKSVLRLMGKTMVLSNPSIQNDSQFCYSPYQSESTTNYANIWPSLGPQNQNYQQLLQSGNHLGSLSSSSTFLNPQTSHEHLVQDNCDLMWVRSGSCAQPPLEVRSTPNDKCNRMWISSNRCSQPSPDNIILQSSMGSYHGSHNFVTPDKSFSTIGNEGQEHPLQASLSQATPSFLSVHEGVTRNFMAVPPTRVCQECEPPSSRRTCKSMHSRLAMQENPVNSTKAASHQWLPFSNQILPDFHKHRCERSTICSWTSDARQRDQRKEPPEVVIIDDDDEPTASNKPNQVQKVNSSFLGSTYTNFPIPGSLHVSENSAKNTPMETDHFTAWELANTTDIDTNRQALVARVYQNENLGFSGTGSKVTFLDLVKQQSSKKLGNSQSIVNLSRRRNCSHLSKNWKVARTSESGFPGNFKAHDCSPPNHVLQSGDGSYHTSWKAASTVQAIKAAVEKLHMDECRNWTHSSEAPSSLKKPCQYHQRNAASSFGMRSSCSYDYPVILNSTDPSQKNHYCMKPTGSSLGICSTNMNPAEMECTGCWSMRLQHFPSTLEHAAHTGHKS